MGTVATAGAEVAELMRRRQVEVMCGQSRSSIYRGIAARTFPAPVQTPSGPRWKRSEIKRWMERLK